MKKILFIFSTLILSACLVSPALALSKFSQGLRSTGERTALFSGSPDVIIAQVVSGLLTLVGAVFIALIVYGGFVYMTAAGSDEKIKKSKKIIISSVIGLLIITGGYTITYFVTNTLENPGGQGVPDYRQECEDTSSLDYYSINCCEYRYLVYGAVDASCCGQTAFANAHPDDCLSQ